MSESIFCFGPDRNLVGVLHSPASIAAPKTAVVMWNVGLNHRVGPSRTWVELARRLGPMGVGSLRFDLGGLGDSSPRRSPSDDTERAVLDLVDALDALEGLGWERFIFVSNCSGTDASHRVAAKDPRVVATVYLDGYTYPTTRSIVMQRVGHYFSRRRWKRWLRTRWPQLFGFQRFGTQVGAREEIYLREYPPRANFELDIAAMVARSVKLLFIYTGETSYRYESQFFDWLQRKDWGDQIRVIYSPQADHVYAREADRKKMLTEVEQFIVRTCRSGAAVPAATGAAVAAYAITGTIRSDVAGGS